MVANNGSTKVRPLLRESSFLGRRACYFELCVHNVSLSKFPHLSPLESIVNRHLRHACSYGLIDLTDSSLSALSCVNCLLLKPE